MKNSASLATRLTNSPLLLVGLLLFVGPLAYALYQNSAARASTLPGYDFAKHPETLVICSRQGCSCEAHATEWTTAALARKKDVVVLANKWEPDIAAIKQRYGPQGVTVLLVSNPTVFNHYSPSGKTTLSLVRYGRIVQQAVGNDALSDVLRSLQEASR